MAGMPATQFGYPGPSGLEEGETMLAARITDLHDRPAYGGPLFWAS